MSSKQPKYDFKVLARGAPGRSTRLVGIRRSLKYIVLMVGLWLATRWLLSDSNGKYSKLTLSVSSLFFLGLFWLNKQASKVADPWINGAIGEHCVAEVIDKLQSENFKIIHDVPNGRGNFDHIVVGRPGIFIIETKAHHGEVDLITNHICINASPIEPNPIKQVRRQAAMLADKIAPLIGRRPYVNPVLCFVNAWINEKALTIDHVQLTRPQFLAKIITKGKTQYSKEEVSKIAAAIRD